MKAPAQQPKRKIGDKMWEREGLRRKRSSFFSRNVKEDEE